MNGRTAKVFVALNVLTTTGTREFKVTHCRSAQACLSRGSCISDMFCVYHHALSFVLHCATLHGWLKFSLHISLADQCPFDLDIQQSYAHQVLRHQKLTIIFTSIVVRRIWTKQHQYKQLSPPQAQNASRFGGWCFADSTFLYRAELRWSCFVERQNSATQGQKRPD